jgi:hypothetical protein
MKLLHCTFPHVLRTISKAGRLLALFASVLLFQGVAWARTEIAGAEQPQLFRAPDGRIWLAYAHNDELFATSSKDGGVTFAPAVKVAVADQFMIGMRRGPRIVAEGGRITVTIIGRELMAFHSTDGGVTWSRGQVINEVPGSAREGLHDLAAAAGGRVFVTWLDLRNGKMELWGSHSADGGMTWAKNELVYRSPDKSVCECCHPSAKFGDDGRLALMWRNSIAGDRDLWVATENPGQAGFSAQKLGLGTWTLNACPMDGGDIIARSGGAFSTVWQRAGEVFLCLPGETEIRLGRGSQPVGTEVGSRTVVVWQDGSQLMLARDAGKALPVKHADHARYAALIATEKDHALLAYEHGKAGESRLVVERL